MKMGPQEDYIETVFTCKGDFNDPNLHLQLEEFYEGLCSLLLPDSCQEKLILKKVEPWNSVRVTFNIPRAAALKLKQLAQQGDTNLRRLGVLAVQIEGDQSISLTIAGKNNERTELVFKTGSGDGSMEASMSVLDSVASGSSVEATRKNIKEYLRQGDALLDPFLSHLGQGSELLKSPNVVATSSDPIPFLTGETTTLASSGKSHGGLHSSPLHGLVFPAGRSPTGYPTSPSLTGRSVAGSNPQKFNSYSHGRTGVPHARQTIGNLLLPPPPPYPHPQVVSVNSIQKPTRPMTSSSPLLVNLLQNDPSGGLLHSLTQGKLPELLDGSLDAIALAKKKRKKRKKKQARLAAEAAAREAAMAMESVPNTAVTSTSSTSLPGFKKSVKKSKPSVSSGLAADHSTQLSDVLESAADKLVNPYTGLLEPADASGDSTSGSSLVPDQQEKIDTIQAAINRVAAAWTEHTSVAEETVSTNTSSVLTSSLSSSPFDVTASTSPLVSLAQGSLPVHSLACSTSPYVTPLSAAPSFDKGNSLDALAISSVCDRPTNDPHHRTYDMNFSQSNRNNINPSSESFPREPLLAMQHVAYSVGLPSGPRPSGPISTPSHMQPQLSMQETFSPKTTCTLAMSKPSFSSGDTVISRMGGLPGGHSVQSSTVPEKSRNFTPSVAGVSPQLPLRRHAGTPPHSVLGSPPMTSQAERPRSTGSYPLSRAGDGKGLAEAVSKMSPHFQPIAANVHPGNHGQLSFENERTKIQIQSLGAYVSKGATITQSQNLLQLSETQTAYSHPKVDIPKKGNDEINNSNHDSGLSSQSEAADENLLTDETASSCGTQGSPVLTVAENIKVEHGRSHVKVETQASIAVAVPTSSHPISHHHAALSGNPLYHKDPSVHAVVNCNEALVPHNPTAASANPTVLHWNTRDAATSGSQTHTGAESANRDSQPTEQKNVLQKQCDKEQTQRVRCQSPENTKTLVSANDGLLVIPSRESDVSLCRPEITHLSVTVSSGAEIREASHPASVRDKGMVTVPPYRTLGYAPSSGAPVSYCGGDTYGNYHTDKARSVPIMSATVYQGHKDKGVGELAEVKPHLQSSAIGSVPGLPDLRTAKLYDNASSACPESHADSLTKNLRLHNPFVLEAPGGASVSSSLPLSYKSPVETVPRLGAVPSHNSSANHSQGYSSSAETHSVNSYKSQPVPISSHWNDTADSRPQAVPAASAPTITENCRPRANERHGSLEALSYSQHYVNPLNVQMCNTASSVSASSSLEAAHGMTQPTATAVTSDPHIVRTSHPNNTTHGRTSVSQSPIKLAQLPKVNTHIDVNGPTDFGELRSSQREVGNCHSNDHGSQDSESVESVTKPGGHVAQPNLPVISGDILDKELLKNCNSNDVQMIEDHAVQNYVSVEPSVIVQRGTFPSLQSSSLRASSPDHLKGSNVTSMYTRKSPTSKSSGGGNMLNMFASVLPLPKLLTESMQKVVKPLPGSAKDPEGSVKLARRNQGHPNLLSHNASSSYSKSPPLGYDSVQGASSVLTPPKSPVRFGTGEAMTMGLAKPQSPRNRSPHVSPAAGSHPPPPLSNMPVSSSFNSTALTRMAEPHFSTDGIDHNGQDIPKRESFQATDSLNNGPWSAQGTVDNAHVQSWNGANTQPSGQQKITHEQTSIETTYVKVEAATGSVSVTDTAVCESNTLTTLDVTVSESKAPHEPPAIQNLKTGHSGKQVPSGLSEHSEGLEGQDLCKAKLSCPSQSSIMHHVSSVETTACDQTTVGHTASELSGDSASAQITVTEKCEESSVVHECSPLLSTRSEQAAPISGVESSTAHTEPSVETPHEVEESAENVVAEHKPSDTVEEVSRASGESKKDPAALGETKERVSASEETLEKAAASVESKEMASTCVEAKDVTSTLGESKDVAFTTDENKEIPSVSEDSNPNASASGETNRNAAASVEPSRISSDLNVPQGKSLESVEPSRQAPPLVDTKEQTQSADMGSSSEDTSCPGTSTALSPESGSTVGPQANPEVNPQESNLSEVRPDETIPCAELQGTERVAEVISESAEQNIVPNSMADVMEVQDIPVDQSIPEGQSGEPSFQAPDSEPEMPQPSVESGQAAEPNVSAVTDVGDEVHVPTEDHKSGIDSNTESVCDCTQSSQPPVVEEAIVSKPEEEHLRPPRSARKVSESELPMITKTLRGGKQIEEAPRAGRASKTPKRKEEDNSNKVSPDAEASPQLRQRRSRRRLPDADGNAGEHTAAKRSRVDGLDEAHGESGEQDGVVLMDGESNDLASCDHNDVEDSVDHVVLDGAHVESAPPDSEIKNSGEDKTGNRQQKDARRGSDASKPVLRDSKRDVRQNAAVTDHDVKGRGKGASERMLKANEEEHVTRSSRRNRQSPSGGLDKTATPATRDRSPVCRTRNRTPDQPEESPDQQYKRTTRSTKPKEHAEPVTTNRRRRTSRDHR